MGGLSTGQRVRVTAGEGIGEEGYVEGEYGTHGFGYWVLIDGETDAEAFEYFELEAI